MANATLNKKFLVPVHFCTRVAIAQPQVFVFCFSFFFGFYARTRCQVFNIYWSLGISLAEISQQQLRMFMYVCMLLLLQLAAADCRYVGLLWFVSNYKPIIRCNFQPQVINLPEWIAKATKL